MTRDVLDSGGLFPQGLEGRFLFFGGRLQGLTGKVFFGYSLCSVW